MSDISINAFLTSSIEAIRWLPNFVIHFNGLRYSEYGTACSSIPAAAEAIAERIQFSRSRHLPGNSPAGWKDRGEKIHFSRSFGSYMEQHRPGDGEEKRCYAHLSQDEFEKLKERVKAILEENEWKFELPS